MAVRKELLLGNEAIARGLVEAGVRVMTAYPGTPSSEILPAVELYAREMKNPTYCEWSVNEKVAVENALAATYLNQRAACAMKMVGLNVALDPVMSAAYIGVKGGFIIISADDPGPHSSQTEQDSRVLGWYAKLPVFDPDSPEQARDLVEEAFAISERYEIPAILRPVMRLCHARQVLAFKKVSDKIPAARFERDPMRWAAIPRSRLMQHQKLNQKLADIAREFAQNDKLSIWQQPLKKTKAPLGILASGVSAAMARDLLQYLNLSGDLPFLQIAAPFPLPLAPVQKLINNCQRVLVLEETEPLLELLAPMREKLWGRFSGHVESAGELTPERMLGVLEKACKQAGLKPARASKKTISVPDTAPIRKPNLCAGCGHRAAFYAMKRTFPHGVFTGDIGCYTLGLNQSAVDTCHDMGASINFAASISRTFMGQNQDVPVLATIGDSTFYHSGPAGLINSVYNQARFVLLILDNAITSMTGMQPTPGTGVMANGHTGGQVDMVSLVKGCGVDIVETIDPYDIAGLMKTLRVTWNKVKRAEKGAPAVVICSHACVAHNKQQAISRLVKVDVAGPAPGNKPQFNPPGTKPCIDCGRCVAICPAGALKRVEKGIIEVNEKKCVSCRLCAQDCPTGTMHMPPQEACTACGICQKWFACPGLRADEQGYVQIDRNWCVDCGLCINVCAQEAIK